MSETFNLKLVTNFDELIKLVNKTSNHDRKRIWARCRVGIDDGMGRPMLAALGLDARSADIMAGDLKQMMNNPAPEALCYLIGALCTIPQPVLYGPRRQLWKMIRLAFKRAAVREEMGWHDVG